MSASCDGHLIGHRPQTFTLTQIRHALKQAVTTESVGCGCCSNGSLKLHIDGTVSWDECSEDCTWGKCREVFDSWETVAVLVERELAHD